MIVASEKDSAKQQMEELEKHISDLSKQEMKELLLVNTYKLNLVRSQMEAVCDVLIDNDLTSYEEIWEKTDKNFKNSNL